MRALRKYGYSFAVVVLFGLIGIAAAFLLVVALPDLQRSASGPAASGTPSPPPSAGIIGMSWLQLPPNADCSACHSTDTGIGVVAAPALAHPVTGWTRCTACHADDRLVKTAPGHTGIHATQCLLCHQQAPGALLTPLSRPHRDLQNQACLSCHGATAPLPTDMSHRTQSVCWLCHRLAQDEPPLPNHAVTVGEKDCLTCHVAGSAGALPSDHAARTDVECMLCHEPREMAPTPSSLPPELVSGVPAIPIIAVGWWDSASISP